MNLTSAYITHGLQAVVTPIAPSANKGTVGSTTQATHPLANIIYAIKATAAAASNVATLTLSTGVCAQTTGSPVILRSGVDMQGNALPTTAKIHGIRLTAPAANAAAVAIGGSSSGLLPALNLQPGATLLIDFKAAGNTVGASTLSATFATLSDAITIEVLGQTA